MSSASAPTRRFDTLHDLGLHLQRPGDAVELGADQHLGLARLDCPQRGVQPLALAGVRPETSCAW